MIRSKSPPCNRVPPGSLFPLVLFFLLLACAPCPGKDYRVDDLRDPLLAGERNFICNPDAIVSPEDVLRINGLALALRNSKGIELAVAAVKSTGDQDSRQFAVRLFEHWKPGEAGKDNGLLGLLVTEPPQRSVVFEVGYGLEGQLPDASCHRLQQELMIPDLKEGNYSLALVKGVQGIAEHFASGGALFAIAPEPDAEAPGWLFYALSAILWIAVVVVFVRIFRLAVSRIFALAGNRRVGGGILGGAGLRSSRNSRSGGSRSSSRGGSTSSSGSRSGSGSRGGRSGGGGSRSTF